MYMTSISDRCVWLCVVDASINWYGFGQSLTNIKQKKRETLSMQTSFKANYINTIFKYVLEP